MLFAVPIHLHDGHGPGDWQQQFGTVDHFFTHRPQIPRGNQHKTQLRNHGNSCPTIKSGDSHWEIFYFILMSLILFLSIWFFCDDGMTHAQPLSARRNEHERCRKQIKEMWHRELKRMQESVGNLRKAKALYVQRQQEWERAKEAAQRAESAAESSSSTAEQASKLDKRKKTEEDALQKVSFPYFLLFWLLFNSFGGSVSSRVGWKFFFYFSRTFGFFFRQKTHARKS